MLTVCVTEARWRGRRVRYIGRSFCMEPQNQSRCEMKSKKEKKSLDASWLVVHGHVTSLGHVHIYTPFKALEANCRVLLVDPGPVVRNQVRDSLQVVYVLATNFEWKKHKRASKLNLDVSSVRLSKKPSLTILFTTSVKVEFRYQLYSFI